MNFKLNEKLGILRTKRFSETCYRAIVFVYKWWIRSLLPSTGFVYYSNIPISKDKKAFDRYVRDDWKPKSSKDKPLYEKTLIDSINFLVQPDEKVVIVGGGVGITALITANIVGEKGKVFCYEGSRSEINKIRRTLKLNHYPNNIEVTFGIVGASIGVYGEGSKSFIDPKDLPECDVMELDCEGSELGIIQKIEKLPKKIIVESHGIFGAPTIEVEKLLKLRGYRTKIIDVAEPRIRKVCEKNDIYILTGILESENK